MKTNSRMILFFMTMVSTSYVQGQTNLLPNGDFSDSNGITGWTAQGSGSLYFAAGLDADGATNSGSLQVNANSAISGCFNVTANSPYQFGGKYVVTNSFGAVISLKMSCNSFSDNSCRQEEMSLGTAVNSNPNQTNANANFSGLPRKLRHFTASSRRPFKGVGTDAAEMGMATSTIVEDLDVVEDVGATQQLARFVDAFFEIRSFFRLLKNDSATALSQQLPRRLILGCN